MALSASSFEYIRVLARDAAAIILDPGKEYLVETRLAPIARETGAANVDEFVTRLKTDIRAAVLRDRVIDALTTNETFFFRDFHPFEAIRQHILPQLAQARAQHRTLNIWSAACSTGQEAYSIAMLIRESFPHLAGWNVRILGTDLSPTVLNQAREASYSQVEVNRGLPAIYLAKYFTRSGDRWFVKDDVKRMVRFESMNLVKPWPSLPTFDLVMLRNVMIYFDAETKKGILRRLRGTFARDGYLFLGCAETTLNLDNSWKSTPIGKALAHQLGAAAMELPKAA
jgi:chemotaxis protein methyltransferase CheR